jgi:hypothetical protein
MKNFFFISICIFIVNILKAQTNIGFKAGYNYTTARVYVESSKQNSQYKSGYGFGIMFKAPFDGVLHFSPYMAYNRKGYKYFPAGDIKEIENTIHYIDIAPGVSFDFPLQQNKVFVVGFSPVLSFAISGKEKNQLPNSSVVTKNMKFNFSNYSLVDIGFNGSIGYRFNNKFLIESSCLYGVANIENNDFKNRKISNLMFNFSIGYYYK